MTTAASGGRTALRGEENVRNDQHPDKASAHGGHQGATDVEFRVWAPHAEKVYVTGAFNGWSKTATPLAGEENGYWSTAVSEAKTGG